MSPMATSYRGSWTTGLGVSKHGMALHVRLLRRKCADTDLKWILKDVRLEWFRHAGYSYCGDTAAFAYRQIEPEKV